MPKNAVGEPFSLSLISDIEKIWMRGWWGGGTVSRYSVENFLSHSAEKIRRTTLCGVTNFGYRKMLGINRKNIWHDRDSNPKPTAWERCYPNPTAVIYFWKKRVGSFALKKKRNLTLLNEQDGRLAPAYFSQEYKYFDQHLPTVKIETTV